MFIPVDRAKIVANGVVPADMRNNVDSNIPVNLLKDRYITSKDGYTLSSAKAMQARHHLVDGGSGMETPGIFRNHDS